MTKPIPKNLLNQVATYNAYLTDTGEGHSFATSVNLLNIRIEEGKVIARGKDMNEVLGNALMFYDLSNSSGLTSFPPVNSKITYNSHIYHIVSTDILRDDKEQPHHYEIYLK